MAIQRVEDKNKLLSKVELHPKRTYISGSWGVSGSIYVFPNRSETQKDNIDERLNMWPIVDGTAEDYDPNSPPLSESLIIRPYSGDSLEARRLEIYAGNFNKFDQNLSDAVSWEYKFYDVSGAVVAWAAANPSETVPFDYDPASGLDFFFASSLNAWVSENPTGIGVDDYVEVYSPYDTSTPQYTLTWTSNSNWQRSSDGSIYNRLPETDRDFAALNYEVPLALLFDGADPETADHAYRAEAAHQYNQGNTNYSLGNSSLTGGNPELFQFTGWNYETQNGYPVQTTTITSKEEVNAWPPEIEKWQSNVITNYVVKGYSDLSMHPRNKTKKLISFERANYDYFSPGSMKQRMLYEATKKSRLWGEGWWANNDHSLSLSNWVDSSGNTHKPALVYPNVDNRYVLDYSQSGVSFNLEFWIKPDRMQGDIGCVCQLHGNYAVMLIPDGTSTVNGLPTSFSVSLRTGSAANDWSTISNDIDFRESNGTSGVYISDPYLSVDEWYHVSIRWGRNFNNGQMTVYLNNVVIDEFDGINGTVNGIARSGLIDISYQATNSENKALFVGGYPDEVLNGTTQRTIWKSYSDTQRGVTWPDGASGSDAIDANTGMLDFQIRYQLNSELTELRCWNYPRTELEIGQQWTSRSSSNLNLLWYFPFCFDADHEHFERKPHLDPGELDLTNGLSNISITESLEDIFYGNSADISYDSDDGDDHQKTPYCENWGYIAGVPFVNVGSHIKEYVYGQIGVVIGFPKMTIRDNNVYYDVETGTDTVSFEIDKINYIKDHWKELTWLRCWNSMILPATVPLKSFNKNVISSDSSKKSYYYLDSPSWISYEDYRNLDYVSVSETGTISYNDESKSKKMFSDERWREGERTFADPEIINSNSQFSPPIETDVLYYNVEPQINEVIYLEDLVNNGIITDSDTLPPFSPVISIPIIYYGNAILEGSFVIKTTLASGKHLTIVDKKGVLYVANKDGEPTHAKVGQIDYNFGYLVIYSHLLTDITLEETSLEFRGDKNLHVLQFDVRCPPGLGNESKNPNFQNLRPTSNANESDSVVTYISTIYLHDENLNVIGKVKLAQPIQKREEDSFLFRVKLDF